MLPSRRDITLHLVDDALDAKLQDRTPLCQVAGVGKNNETFFG